MSILETESAQEFGSSGFTTSHRVEPALTFLLFLPSFDTHLVPLCSILNWQNSKNAGGITTRACFLSLIEKCHISLLQGHESGGHADQVLVPSFRRFGKKVLLYLLLCQPTHIQMTCVLKHFHMYTGCIAQALKSLTIIILLQLTVVILLPSTWLSCS